MNQEELLPLQFYERFYVELVLFFPYMFGRIAQGSRFGTRVFFVERLNSIYLISVGLFKLSIFPWVNFGS